MTLQEFSTGGLCGPGVEPVDPIGYNDKEPQGHDFFNDSSHRF